MIRRALARTESWPSVAVSAFLVLVGLGTLVEASWRYAPSDSALAVAALQILGSLSAVAIGIGIAWLEAKTAREKR
ncbi:hypothetical protein [Haloferax denitrificans]|uniref:DUF8123 domain-containing protein n=1 Tax=Haloferax denitrificans ATCC 35960 TaxID=662478 RepID=M0JJW3_9EURY|nr:hypothetical protein [Haloferax denitrificans]EMA08618.1 hypothetical protein C438_02225 [Haloferax denitrificans ATCC 35960]